MKKRIKILIVLGVVLIIAVIFVMLYPKNQDTNEYTTVVIQEDTLVQTVSEVGAVKAIKEIKLNFLQAGKLSKIFSKVGDKVAKDQVLAELDYNSLLIKKTEAESSLEITAANLDKLLAGATVNEVAVSKAQVSQAETSYLSAIKDLEQAKTTVAESISQAQKKLDDLESSDVSNVTSFEQAVVTAQLNLDNAIATYQQGIDNNLSSTLTTINYQLSLANLALDKIQEILDDDVAKPYLSAKNSSYLILMTNLHDSAESLCATAVTDYDLADSSGIKDDVYVSLESSLDCLNETFDALDSSYSALNSSITSSTFSQTALDAYVATINTQITTMNTGISALQTARQNLNSAYLSYQTNIASARDSLSQAQVNLSDAITSARNSLNSALVNGEQQKETARTKVEAAKESWQVAERQSEDLQSTARIEDINLHQAQIKQAQASLDLIMKQIEDNIIISPIDGQIVTINYEVGEQTSLGKPIFHLLAQSDFEVEIDISESDINKLKVGNSVEITFDAFGEDKKFQGRVSFIEPAETVIQEVIYYKAKIELINVPNSYLQNIKPGMTANTTIVTNFKSDVLVVPNRAIVDKNGDGKFIRVLDMGEMREVPIETGMRGDEGMIEIISGLEAGAEVVTYIKENK